MTSALSSTAKTRPLPSHLDLPCEDASVPHDFFEHPQSRLLTSSVEFWLRRQRPGFDCVIGQDNYIYWDITTPPTLGAKAPDWFLVPGVPHLLDGNFRRSYVLWNEHVAPALVMEFMSEWPGGEWDKTPRTGKYWVYEQGIRAQHYAIFDPGRDQLDAFDLVDGRFQPAKLNERGHYPIDSLGLEYGLWRGEWARTTRLWLRFWDSNGHLLLTPEEEGHRAEREKQKAFDKLRELGIDPEKLS
jgi:Uma2 family endonuclease